MCLRMIGLVALLFAGFATSAQAAVIINVVDTGDDVVFTAEDGGSLNLTAFDTEPLASSDFGRINPTTGVFRVGPVPAIDADRYVNPEIFMSPSTGNSFGTGGDANGSFGAFGLIGLIPGGQDLVVPDGYTSGDLFVGPASTTYENQDFASLGLNVGSFTWSWDTTGGGNADSITLNIVPEPSTAALTALGLIGLASRRRRP